MKIVKNQNVCWNKEYKEKGIPSSFRDRPSNAVIWSCRQARIRGRGKHALDLGCGTGRNARELARRDFRVTAIDFSQTALAKAQKNSTKNIRYLRRDLTKPLPFKKNSFDLIVDIFCSVHIVQEPARTNYRTEIIRVLKSGGFYVLALATPDDGYYGPILKKSGDRKRSLLTDPACSVPVILSTAQQIRREWKPLRLKKIHSCTKNGMMHGKIYRRKSLAFLFRK